MGILILKTPVKAIKTENYSAVLKTKDGVTHYWDQDGEYDGCTREPEGRVLAIQEELKL